jgi:hypothetical protein
MPGQRSPPFNDMDTPPRRDSFPRGWRADNRSRRPGGNRTARRLSARDGLGPLS